MKVLKLKVKTVSLKVTVKYVFDGEGAYPGDFILRVGQGIRVLKQDILGYF